MVGDFQKNHRLIQPESYNNIESGTPIVADMGSKFPRLQFGIYADGGVIIQRYIPKLLLTVFEYIPLNIFTNSGNYDLYEYIPTKYSYDKAECLSVSLSYIGKYFMGYTSVLGDDFVFKCMVGDSFNSFFSNSKIGRHYKYRYKESSIYLYHHFIAIEGDCVVHFSEGSEKNAPTLIRMEDLNEVRKRMDFPMEEVVYKDDSLSACLASRNRAIYEWSTGNEFGGYNIIINNCEHFANYCRKGKKKSGQVGRLIGELALSIIATYATKKPLPIFLLKKGILININLICLNLNKRNKSH